MAARSPRRRFANPFVITLAACTPATTPPVHQPVVQTDPKPEPAKPDTTIVANPPRPGPRPDVPTTTVSWTVTKSNGTCQAMASAASACPAPPPGQPARTCNPPPPMKYTCPDGIADNASLTVTQLANQAECMILPGPMSCPKNASCNPPPPRKVACPHY